MYGQEEFLKYVAALPRVQLEFNPYNSNSKIAKIYRHLVKHSGKNFPVLPAQTYNGGQAHQGGIIIIDISKLSEPKEVLAFWLAHEWGHQDLGHTANIWQPSPVQKWKYRVLPTAKEDEADEYAAEFLAKYGYSIDRVVWMISRLPSDPNAHAYSDGPIRAKKVKATYLRAKGHGGVQDEADDDVTFPPPRLKCRFCGNTGYVTVQVTCQGCRGRGRLICANCAGSGRIYCRNCRGGVVVMMTPFGPRQQMCPCCFGRPVQPCVGCRGTGQLICAHCGGRGGGTQRQRCQSCQSY